MVCCRMFLLFALLVGVAFAQRPDNATLCDYYAGERYGESTNVTQAKLIQSIITLAFGGPFDLPNAQKELTGILNQGTFDGLAVDLRPWFDGTKDSSNFNNGPANINWLDEGTQPLKDFLNNKTETVVIDKTSNQYRLFTHWLTAFSHAFGCTFPIPPVPTTGATGGTQRLSLAYVHKYMDLNHTHLGYFINQLGEAAIYYGFRESDANQFTSSLNAQYNVRCAPPITLNPAQGPQLLSLCQDESCPLATSPQCALYENLEPGGLPSSAITGRPSTTTGSTSSTSPPTTSTTTSSSPATTTPATSSSSGSDASRSSSSHSNSLGPGAIAGIAISSVAVLLMAIGLALWYFKKRTPKSSEFTPSTTYGSPSYTDPHTSYVSQSQSPGMVEQWIPPPMPQPMPPIHEIDGTQQYGTSSPGLGGQSPNPGHQPMIERDQRWTGTHYDG